VSGGALHSLSEYADLLREKGLLARAELPGGAGAETVRSLAYDSRKAAAGTLFICKGARFSPTYLEAALKAGAFACIADESAAAAGLGAGEQGGEGIPRLIVTDIRAALAAAANLYYNDVWKKLSLVGITGTKGKSTTAYYVKYILDAWSAAQGGKPCAILSGIDNYDGRVQEESHLTTPETLELHRHFQNAVDSGIRYLSMEVSSQALKYDRTGGVRFDVACFLNLGEDHISAIEHSDYEDYLSAKLRIFSQCEAACVNLESAEAPRILAAASVCPARFTLGFSEAADFRAYGARTSADGISFRVKSAGFDEEFALSMTGLFNVENALAAIAAARRLDIPAAFIRKGLRAARVSGRMEVFRDARGRTVVVDYAHNKMSFERLFQSVAQEYPGRKIHIVFGCPGGKALGRRRELGLLAGGHADRVYLTEEDAGEEAVLDICREIAAGVAEGGDPACAVIPDREEAIRRALSEAGENTVLLITGKGRETRQKRGTRYVTVPSDVEYVNQYL
jgi:UDP-N-acetylmuramoyl-L-alanyl-D-glutamate--2,6-diaminopimelate ligase